MLARTSKKNSRRKSPPARVGLSRTDRHALQDVAESRTAVAATVAWMLSLMATITAEIIGLICRWYTILIQPSDLLTIMSSVMLFVALVAGIATLGLIPVVLRVAKTRPPQSIVQIAMIAGGLPIVVVAVQYFRHL